MTRGIVHRLRRLEELSAATDDSYFHPHLIRFITPEGEVASALQMEYGSPASGRICSPKNRQLTLRRSTNR